MTRPAAAILFTLLAPACSSPGDSPVDDGTLGSDEGDTDSAGDTEWAGGTDDGDGDGDGGDGDGACSDWMKEFGTAENDGALGVVANDSGDIYIAGVTHASGEAENGSYGTDALIAKLNSSGVVLWTHQFGSPLDDSANDIGLDGSGNVYVVGSTDGDLDGNMPNTDEDESDPFIRKYSPEGSLLWSQQIERVERGGISDLAVTSSGDLFVTGTTYGVLDGGENLGATDIYITKYSSEGVEIWTRQLGTPGSDFGRGIAVNASGEAYVTGHAEGWLGGSDGPEVDSTWFLAKYSPDGDSLWIQQSEATQSHAYGVALSGSDEAYVVGRTLYDFEDGTLLDSGDTFVAKSSPDGVNLWTERRLGTDNNTGSAIAVSDSGILVTGGTNEFLEATGGVWFDAFVTKYTESGVELWDQQFGGEGYDWGRSIAVNSSGDAYVVGEVNGASAGNEDVFVRKICNQ